MTLNPKLFRRLLFSLCTALILALLPHDTTRANEPLPVDAAIQFSIKKQNSNSLQLHWHITPGVYLYKDRLQLHAHPENQIRVGQIVLPTGLEKSDKILGNYQIYRQGLELDIPIDIQPYATVADLRIQVRYQGCTDAGYCYPPVTKEISWPEADAIVTVKTITAENVVASTPLPESEATTAQNLLQNQPLWLILSAFAGFGILLAFTPCVLPMLPILSGLILGRNQHLSHSKALLLAVAYVLGMALTYAALGIVATLLGSQFSTTLQKPWILILFSACFVALALSLFGYYDIRLPSRLQNLFNRWSQQQMAGSLLGVTIMGALSALLVSPCITPPLVGALTYMGNTGNIILGGSALFALGLGMGLPLIAFVMMGSKLLPKSGPWMRHVEQFFGVVLLGVAISLLTRILPGPLTLLLWAGLLFFATVLLGTFRTLAKNPMNHLAKTMGLLAFAYGTVLTSAAYLGQSDPLHPFSSVAISKVSPFQRIKSVDDFMAAQRLAIQQKKPLIIDFYADWCTSCKEMDRHVFTQPPISQKLNQCFVAIQADITRVDAEDKKLLQHLNVIAPPTLVFFDSLGNELKDQRLVGDVDRAVFLKHLAALAAQSC